jgi:hypothetical protein
MACKIVSYDLDKPHRNYEDLHKAIKNCGAWWHHLESVWILDSSMTTKAIRDNLEKHIDSGDKLVVFKLSSAWATSNLKNEANEWLQNHL